jgi:phosphoribosylglycinamide formyltransferase-1
MAVKICIPVSGTCSLLKAILASGIRVDLIVADREKGCLGREVAAKVGVSFELVPRTFDASFDRREYTLRFIEVLKRHDIAAVFMAGFNTILDKVMFQPEHFEWRITNTHPALLPAFPGHFAVRDALQASVKETGCTIHLATEVMDDSRFIIAQRTVPVENNDTVDTLWERIKVEERKLYPEVIRAFVTCVETGRSLQGLKV